MAVRRPRSVYPTNHKTIYVSISYGYANASMFFLANRVLQYVAKGSRSKYLQCRYRAHAIAAAALIMN